MGDGTETQTMQEVRGPSGPGDEYIAHIDPNIAIGVAANVDDFMVC